MATVWGVTWGDGWVAALEGLITTLTNSLEQNNQLMSQYNSWTVEGSQALSALGDRKAMYEQAILAYSDTLNKIKSTGDAAKRGSALKEQANKWYATGMATKKWATSAEAMKDIADISGAWVAERANIQSQTDTNYASAASNLWNLYANIADQEAQLASIQAQTAASRSASDAQTSLARYKAWLASQWQWTTVANTSWMTVNDVAWSNINDILNWYW